MLPPIIEFEGRYFHRMNGASRYYLSKSGAVYSTRIKRVMKIPPQTDGYLQTGFRMDDGTTKRLQVHRLVALQFIPNPDPERKLFVNHCDGNKNNCHVWNLAWVTAKENDQHARATGLTPNGMKRTDPAALFAGFCKAVSCYYAAPTLTRFSPR